MQHGLQQLTPARPKNLDTEAVQNKRRQPHGDVGAAGAEQPLNPRRVGKHKKMVMAIATAAARLAKTKTISSVELVDPGQSKADHDRNCPRPSSEGQGQWMGGLIEQLGPRDAIRGGFQLLMAAFAEKRPFGHGDDKAAGDPQRYRYSVELEDQRAQEKRADENEKRVPGNAPSEDATDLRRGTSGQSEKDERRSWRIDHWTDRRKSRNVLKASVVQIRSCVSATRLGR